MWYVSFVKQDKCTFCLFLDLKPKLDTLTLYRNEGTGCKCKLLFWSLFVENPRVVLISGFSTIN